MRGLEVIGFGNRGLVPLKWSRSLAFFETRCDLFIYHNKGLAKVWSGYPLFERVREHVVLLHKVQLGSGYPLFERVREQEGLYGSRNSRSVHLMFVGVREL